MNLLVLGPQGSGKGTQAKMVCKAHRIPHISTGDMLRAAIADASELGRKVKAVLDAGELVSDALTDDLVAERLARSDAADGFVLDGYPRNLAQADALDEILNRLGLGPISAALFFDLADDIATERMLARAAAEGRSDDTPAVIAKRLEIYHEQTAPLVDRYRRAGTLVPLHAERSVADVQDEINEFLSGRSSGGS